MTRPHVFWRQATPTPDVGTTGVVRAVALVMLLLVLNAAGALTNQFDFGAAGTEPGYVAVDNITTYPGPSGYYGWISTNGLYLRDRGVPNLLYRDFIFTTVSSATFRVSGLTPSGKYLMRVTCGDASYGDHVITVSVPGAGTLPTMSPATSQYQTLSATVDATVSGILEITFGSPTPNWVVNALTLAPTNTTITPFIESNYIFASTWDPAVFTNDPTTNLLNRFNGAGAVGFTSTGLTRSNYLALVTGEIDFWKTKQDANGAIIDPYRGVETQYSTPAFANAAAALVVYAGRTDLLEPAAKAMDWASLRLHNNAGADGHDDFYPGMLAHTLRLLSPLAAPSRVTTWRANLDYDPYAIYDYAPGSFNWTVIASCGDALLQLMGIRSTNNTYVTEVWAAQGGHFLTPYGLYLEGPMCYDIFPRIFWCDALAQGYAGPSSAEVRQAMDRAAIASLFMQSPWGELPAGGRSAHHQWNEAEQCLLYEIYAAKAKAAGNMLMAGAYKRAAHLAFSSMPRWVRSSGEMQIVKNWVDPSSRFGYESYSYHSQYNLLPMMMLATAYEYADSSEDVPESPSPADTGGFVFQLDRMDQPTRPHKIVANAGGTYVEIESNADNHYDATGLIRVHRKGIVPQLGPSDSLLASASYNSPNPSPITTGIGVSWQDSTGAWRTLGEMDTEVTSVTLTPILQSPSNVVFDVTYSGSLPNVTSITEHYVITPDGVQLTTQMSGYSGPLRYVWPVLSNDGRTASAINVNSNAISVSLGGTPQAFAAPGAQSVSVGATNYSNHNGWARLATAEYPSGGAITLVISNAASSIPTPPAVSLVTPSDAAAWLSSTNDSLLVSVTVSNSSGNPLSMTWSKTSGPGDVLFSASNSVVTSVRFNTNGIYNLTFTADNGSLASTNVRVFVNPISSITNGIAAWWKMDETGGTVASDSSGNGRAATITNGSFVAGCLSNAYQFNAANNRGVYTAVQSNQVTVTAWVRLDGAGGGGYPRIVDTPSYRFHVRGTTVLGFATYDSTGGDYSSDASVSLGGWYHVTASFDRNNLSTPPKLYVNGVKKTTTVLTSPSGTAPSLTGTGYIGNNSANSRNWNGLIDDLRIFNRVLSDDEVLIFATAPSANIAPVVFAGLNQTVVWPDVASLSGSLTDDGNPISPGVVSVTWSRASGPGTVAFGNSNALTTTASFSAPGTYTLQLVANDGQAQTTSSVVVSVISRPPISFNLQNGLLHLSWPTNGWPWRLQAQTNTLATGLGTNWFNVPGSNLTNSMLLPVDAANASVFYRLTSP